MSMIDVIRKEMMTAMKNKDKERKESLSMLLTHRLIREKI